MLSTRLLAVLGIAATLTVGFVGPAFAGNRNISWGTAGTDWITGVGTPDDTRTGSITALNGAVNIPIDGHTGAGVILTGVWVGTVIPEVSADGGTTWVATKFYDIANGATAANTTANGTFAIINIGGMSHVRVKASAYTSGTVTVTLRITQATTASVGGGGTGASADQVQGNAADGAAAVGNPVQVAGKDGSGNIQAMLTDTTGALQTDIESGPTGASALQGQGTAADGAAAVGNPAQVAGKDGSGNIQAVLTDTTGAVRVDPTGTTIQPVSGTVTSNQGTAAAVGNSWRTRLADGTNDAANLVDADSGAGTQYYQGVQLRKSASGGSVELGTSSDPVRTDPTGTTTQPVSGTVTANAGTGTFTVGGAAADGTASAGNPVRSAGKDGSGNTQDLLTDTGGALQVDVESIAAGNNNIGDVDVATIAAGDNNIGNVDLASALPAGTNYIGKVRPTDGTNDLTTLHDVDSGVGTQYTLGISLRKTASGGSVEAGTSADPLRVDPTGTTAQPITDNNGSLTVDGTVTANQGTAAVATNSWRVRVSDGTNDAANLVDADSGAGTDYRMGVTLRKSASGGSVELGTAADPVRTDPTGTTTQPVSGTVTANAGTGTFTSGGTTADGLMASGNPVQTGGVDGAGNVQRFLTDTSGALQVDVESITAGDNNIGNVDIVTGPTGATALQAQGTVADGGMAAQNPVQIGGKDGAGNIQTVLTDTGGAVQVDVESGTLTANQGTAAAAANSWRVRVSDGTNDAANLVDADTGAGTDYRVGVTLRKSASGGSVELGTSADPVRTDPTGTTTQPVSDAGGSLTVDGTVTSNQGAVAAVGNSWRTRLSDGTNDAAALFDADSGAGTQYLQGVQLRKGASGGSVEAGTAADPLRTDPTGTTAQPVTDNGGSLTVDGTVTSNAGTGTFTVGGTAADGVAASGNPVQIGGKDGAGNAQTVLTDTGGAVQVDVESGTLTSNQGTAAAAANSWRVRVSDGTNDAANLVDADTGAGTDYRVGVTLRKSASGGSVELGTSADPVRTDPTGTTTQPVSGTITANAGTGTFTVSGTVTANAGTGNFNVVGPGADGAAVAGNPNRVAGKDGAGNTQDILTDTTGAVQVDVESIAAGTNYIGKVRPTDGTNDMTTLHDTDSGAGTQYTIGISLRKAASGGSVEAGTSTDPLRTDPTGTTAQPITDNGGSLTVDGTVTSNQGTAAAAANSWRTRLSDGTNDAAALFDSDSGAGTQYLQGVALRKSASGGSVELGTASDPVRTDPTGTTIQPVSGTVTANAGTGTFTVSGTVTSNAGTGTFTVGGAAADGAAVSGNPTRVAGKDGAGNTQDILTDTSGAIQVDVESIAAGDNNIGNMDVLSIAAGDNNIGNMDVLSIAAGDNNIGNVDVVTGPTGVNAFEVQGTVADGSAAAQKPVRVAGKDGSGNVQDILTDTTGAVQVDVESLPALSTGPVASNPQTSVSTSLATQLVVASTPCKKVTLVFDDGAASNGASGVMWVGGTSVAANNGIPIRAGQSLTLEVGNANTIWLFTTTASQKVSWIAEN